MTTFMSRRSCGGSVMVWGAISASEKTCLAIIRTTLDSEGYARVLEDYLLPFAYCTYGEKFIFMQDNAIVHKSRVVRECLIRLIWMSCRGRQSPLISTLLKMLGRLFVV